MPAPAAPAIITLGIKNVGDVASGSGFEIFQDGQFLFSGGLPTLAPGQEHMVPPLQFIAPMNGTHELVAKVNIGISPPVQEITYTNNILTTTFIVAGSAPAAPRDVQFDTATVTDTSLRLTWLPSLGAEGYRVDVSTDVYFKTFVGPYGNYPTGLTTALNVTSLTPGMIYYARVRSVNSAGTSPSSEIAGGQTSLTPIGFVPENVTLNQPTATSLVLAFMAPPMGTIAGVGIELSTETSFGSYVQSNGQVYDGHIIPAPTYSFLLSNLSPNTLYFARVKTYALDMTPSTPSEVVMARTLSAGDLAFKSIVRTPSHGHIQPGYGYQVRVTAQNFGPGATTESRAELWPSAPLLPPFAAVTFPSMAPGTESTRIFMAPYPLLTEGKHTLRVALDPSNSIPETDESNNISPLEFTVDATSPTLSLITPTAGSAVSGAVPVTVEFRDNFSLGYFAWSVDNVVVASGTASVNPHTFSTLWDTRALADGPHQIAFLAADLAGNHQTLATTVTVINANAAQRVYLSGAPGATLVARKPFGVIAGMKNTGTTTWTLAGGYKWQSQNPAGNTLWGPAHVSLSSTEAVAPGGTRYFSAALVAPATPGTYSLQYRMAKDGLGAFGEYGLNQSVTVVADTVPPTTPASPALSAASTGTLTFSWGTATDNAAVAYYVIDVSTDPAFALPWPGHNGLNVGKVTSRVLTGLAPGTTYYARVKAVDVNGLSGAKSLTASRATLLTPDTAPPQVTITSPGAGQVLTSNLTAAATASDNNQIKSVVFALDGVAKLTDSAAPYQYTVPVSSLVDGSHTLTATAYDYANNTASQTVVFVARYDRTVPGDPASVFVKFPTVSGLTVTWGAATDNVGVTGYRLDLSLTPTFATYVSGYQNLNVGNVLSRVVTGLTAGTTYFARVRATDANGNVSINNITGVGATLATADTVNPVVSITTPTAGATVSGVVAVNAVASDANGVTQVRFYVDGSLKSTDTEAPFAFLWDTALVATGLHSLQAVAYDPSGRTATHTISVNVARAGVSAAGLSAGSEDTQAAFGLKDAYVYPSPLRGSGGTLRVMTGFADRVRARALSLEGHVVWEGALEGGPNAGAAYEMPVPAAPFGTGVYFLHVESEKDGQTHRTVKKFGVIR